MINTKCLCRVAIVIWGVLQLDAQPSQGTLTGTVVDASGGVIQSASLTITANGVPQFRKTLTSDQGGRFQVQLPAGRYTVRAAFKGFRDAELADILVEANLTRELKIELGLSRSESIIVTARRYEEDLLNVPLSVAAFDADALRERQILRLDDLTIHSPNVNIFRSRGSSDNGAAFIRGIGQEDNVFTADAGVGVYLDDVLLPLAQGELLNMLDMERVEILRGPQGTLYGQNTSAGAVKYMSKRPVDQRTGEVDVTLGNYWRRDFRGVVNLPIVKDKLLSRVSVGSVNRNGFQTNTVTGDHTDSLDTFVGRGVLSYHANDRLDFDLSADGMRLRPSINVGSQLRPVTTALTYPGLLAGQTVVFPVQSDPFRVSADIYNRNALDSWGLGMTAGWHPNAAWLVKSISSYRKLAGDFRQDLDGTAAQGANVFINQKHEQASEEIQVANHRERWNTTAGFFSFYGNDHEFDGTDGSAKGFSLDATYYQRRRSFAGYGQTTGRLTDRLSVTIGLRYSFETKEFGRNAWQYSAAATPPIYNLFGGVGAGPTGVPLGFPGKGTNVTNLSGVTGDWNALTPRFGADYRLTSSVMAYASVSRGFKSGGFNGRASTLSSPNAAQPYSPEYVWTYEAGARASWFNRALTGGLTYFYNDYTDLQLQTFVTPQNGSVYESLLANAGKAVTQGFEFEFKARPAKRLQLFGSTGFTSARYVKYLNAGVDISKQRSLANAPKWTGTFGGQYSVPISTTGFTLDLGGDVNYQGRRFLTVSNLPDLRQGGYTVVNAFASIESPGRRWRVQIGGRNLTDKRYMLSGLDLSAPPFGAVLGYWGDPRTWTIGLSVRF